MKECNCGSGKQREEIVDARGIFVAYVCSNCKKEKLSGYRHEIFTNPCYDTYDECIDYEY
jgi:hypothetical protein